MNRLRRSDGMSLLEVMVAATIFGTVAAGLGVATVGSIRANGSSRTTSAAATLIYDKFDQLRALNAGANPPDLSAGAHADARNPLTPLGQGGGTFTRSWTVTPNTPRVGVSQVVVRVDWTERSPRTMQGVAYLCASATCS
jgi:prepilin-type N-terminal cleavage/methylation domain-containing protein